MYSDGRKFPDKPILQISLESWRLEEFYPILTIETYAV